jgi:polysaccharide export outer membrane protein
MFFACAADNSKVSSTRVVDDQYQYAGLGEEERAKLEEIKKAKQQAADDHHGLNNVIRETPNYSVQEYLALNPNANNPVAQDYRVGGYDVLEITVYEEEDLSRKSVRISADGYITFPLIGRLFVDHLTTSEIERLIADKLAEGGFLLDAHVSVSVVEYKSKQFMVLGSVKEPGTYPLQAKEKVLDAVSRAGGIDFEQGGKTGIIIRTINPNTMNEKKIVIRIELTELLKGGDQLSNILLADQDLLYIPKADYFYIIGQVQKPGSYPYLEKEITVVEAISQAGGFTPIASRNKTRIIRVENGIEKIINVKIDAITKSGKKGQDVLILPGDVIVVPESFF